ncbi:FadR family transcriptional regulator [Paenibacillus sp. MZ04-78.2]|uniref:FadR/GntR family transcriptional regulator n=1 Tax=Paenibacillus sp. MZ04-78.2 TaxID=2962034 RepID=UPI0020B6C36A|nr:FadR/GntR family transcriptional regulator [Paenibacillus sp. MZ04-78.2]MCP3773060.1 FadR family transcriptional regulator [Paenibacillus sp. MZ04-78.2]
MIRKGYEIVADALREQIEQGVWPVGSRIDSVEQLAVKFGVGRSTIREALMSLKAHGWVDVRHGGGTFVLRNSGPLQIEAPEIGNVEQLRQWLELRFILETEGAALAAARRSNDHLNELDGILAEMASLTDEDKLEQCDIRFHLKLAGASGNELLVRTLETLFLTMGPTMRESRRLWLFAEQSQTARLSEEHRAIIDAVLLQNAALARERVASHLRKVEQMLRRLTYEA